MKSEIKRKERKGRRGKKKKSTKEKNPEASGACK
jgi:hypothetical protein